MVIVLFDHVADTPAGKPLAPDTPSFAIPVARTVVWVILVKAVLMQSVGVLEAALTVLFDTIMVPVAKEAPQDPPVNGIL